MSILPTEVAKMIALDGVHPVTAWRHYYRIDHEILAKYLDLSTFDINLIERSNLHLKDDLLNKLAKFFNIKVDALCIRYNLYAPSKI